MGFSDLKTEKGIKILNTHLEDKSYINGYLPSSDDIETFKALARAPDVTFQHALRWYNHIKSFSANEQKQFPQGTACPLKSGGTTTTKLPADDDDDVDLFGSDEEEDADAAKIREDRLSAYAAKKEKKPALIAKSSILLDVKPWDDETDMKKMETSVRTINMDGLLWGASKLVPVGYGIHKLQIMCVIEDDKVSVDLLTEEIEKFEDFVQSVDIAAFNKI